MFNSIQLFSSIIYQGRQEEGADKQLIVSVTCHPSKDGARIYMYDKHALCGAGKTTVLYWLEQISVQGVA